MQFEMHRNDASRKASKLSIEDFFYHNVFSKINNFIAHEKPLFSSPVKIWPLVYP